MLITYGMLALATSIDSIGIGISYGVRKIQFSKMAMLVLFGIAFFSSFLAMIIGKGIYHLLPQNITNWLGGGFLIGMGMIMLLQSTKEPESYDKDNSHGIDKKEAFCLGIALSLDSFSIGIGAGIVENSDLFCFPFLAAIFQVVFLSIGSLLGKKITNHFQLPSSIWNKLAAMLLIIMGMIGLFVS